MQSNKLRLGVLAMLPFVLGASACDKRVTAEKLVAVTMLEAERRISRAEVAALGRFIQQPLELFLTMSEMWERAGAAADPEHCLADAVLRGRPFPSRRDRRMVIGERAGYFGHALVARQSSLIIAKSEQHVAQFEEAVGIECTCPDSAKSPGDGRHRKFVPAPDVQG